jgi:CubicO group peptidase (beta-lactamase class C family)
MYDKTKFSRILLGLLLSAFVLGLTTNAQIQLAQTPEEQGSEFQAIDAYIQSEMQKARIPGLALAIVQGDKLVHSRGFGIASPDTQPVTPQTPFIIGSVSKSFTALAILQLVEAGKIDLDAPVQRYLPWFKVADAAAAETITVRHLLNQTSGFPESAGQRTLADRYSGDDALEREVRSYEKIQLSQQVGAVMQYSNANFNTLGLIVQAVSGQMYESYIQGHIFNPLGMQNSFISISEGQQGGMATGYRKWFGYPFAAHNLPFPRAHLPSGYLISSAEDLAHYTIAQLNNGDYQGQSVLSPEGIALLHQPGPVEPLAYAFKAVGCDNGSGAHYAMGWWSLELNQIPVICHTGDTPNFHADIVLIPEGKWGVVLLMNVSNKLMSEDIHGLITGVVSLVKGQTPVRVTTDPISRIFYFFLIGMLILEIIASIRAILRLRSRPSSLALSDTTKRHGSFRVYRPLLFSLIGASAIFIGIPVALGFSWRLMFLNQPDFAGMLIALCLLILLRGALRSWLNLSGFQATTGRGVPQQSQSGP